MIQEAYCSFEVAKLLKEKGFDEICTSAYSKITKKVESPAISEWAQLNQIKRPTHQIAVAFLMEVHNLYICPKYCCFCGSKPKDRPYFKWEARILKLPSSNIIYPQPLDMCEHYETYEEAVEYAIRYALENLI